MVKPRIPILLTMLLAFAFKVSWAPESSSPPQRPQPPNEITINDIVFKIVIVPVIPTPPGYHGTFIGDTCDQNAFEEKDCAFPDTPVNTISAVLATDLETEKDNFEWDKDTVLHETFHAIVGTKKSDDPIACKVFAKELSPGLLHVLQNNPKLITYLTAWIKEAPTEDIRNANAVIIPGSQEKILTETLVSLCSKEENPEEGHATYHTFIRILSPEVRNLFNQNPAFVVQLARREH